MSVIERAIQVTFRHRVIFTDRVFDLANPVLADLLADVRPEREHKALVVLDESLANAQPDLARRIEGYFGGRPVALKLVAPPMVLEGGERVKNSPHHVEEVQSQIARHHLDRQSYVLAVGGGALLDLVGFAAATAHRGCRHVRLPSTVLSQADSGVGVKNGINLFGKKNFVGTFAPPFAVINDFTLLATLSARDRRAGYVEAVKVALIRDPVFFETLERDAARLAAFAPDAVRSLIRRCAELHVDHIATCGDPFEFGAARPLDFGHWAAHKLEQMSDFRIRHGEAVAIGIALDTLYSRKLGFLDGASTQRVLGLLEALGFDLFANELLNVDSQKELMVLQGLEEFREHLGGELTITLLRAIGQGCEVHEIDRARVADCVYDLEERHLARTREVLLAKGGDLKGRMQNEE